MADIQTREPVAIGPFFEVSDVFCREEIALERGHAYPAGLILGRIGDGLVYAPHDPTASDGREVEAGILVFRLRAGDAQPVSADGLKAVALVRGPAVIASGQLARHKEINEAAEIAAQNAALLKLNILVKEQV